MITCMIFINLNAKRFIWNLWIINNQWTSKKDGHSQI